MEVKCQKCGGAINVTPQNELLFKVFGDISMAHRECIQNEFKKQNIGTSIKHLDGNSEKNSIPTES